MRRIFRPLAVLLVFGTLFSGASPNPGSAPKEIVDAYGKFKNAMRWNSPVALRNLVYEYSTPDFTSNYGGRKGDLYMEVENVIQMGRMVEKVLKVELTIVEAKTRGANCEVTLRMRGEIIGQMDGKRQLVTMNMLSRDTWIKTTAGWKVKHAHGLSESMTMKPYTPKRGR